MEIFAQWLDDFEDLLFTLALLWERIRRGLLRVGLAAALGLPVVDLVASSWVPAVALTALTISAGWLLAAVASEAGRRRRQRA